MALCRRISDLYALALLTVYALFLPLGGYERMMEGKYRAFLLLSLGLRPRDDGAWRVEGCPLARADVPCRARLSRAHRAQRGTLALRHGGAARRHAPGRTSDRRALRCRLSAPRAAPAA